MACLVLIRIDSESLLSGKTKGVAAGDILVVIMCPPLTLIPLAMARFTSAKEGYSEVSLRLICASSNKFKFR